MIAVVSVIYLGDFTLQVAFDNGMTKKVCLKEYLVGEIFEPLKDEEYFKKVSVDRDIETICWDNGADFSPEFLYDLGIDCVLNSADSV